jgi:hypothetical protein
MHHKRKRAKHQRAGCLYCKPHKDNGVDDPPVCEKRGRIDAAQQLDVDPMDVLMGGCLVEWCYGFCLDCTCDELLGIECPELQTSKPLRVSLLEVARVV